MPAYGKPFRWRAPLPTTAAGWSELLCESMHIPKEDRPVVLAAFEQFEEQLRPGIIPLPPLPGWPDGVKISIPWPEALRTGELALAWAAYSSYHLQLDLALEKEIAGRPGLVAKFSEIKALAESEVAAGKSPEAAAAIAVSCTLDETSDDDEPEPAEDTAE